MSFAGRQAGAMNPLVSAPVGILLTLHRPLLLGSSRRRFYVVHARRCIGVVPVPTQMGTMRYFPGCDGSSIGCSTRMEGAGAADTIRVCTLTGFIAAPRCLGFAGTSLNPDYTAPLRPGRFARKAFSSCDGPVANCPRVFVGLRVDRDVSIVSAGRTARPSLLSALREGCSKASSGKPFEIPFENRLTKPLILGYSIQALFYGPVAQLVRAHA